MVVVQSSHHRGVVRSRVQGLGGLRGHAVQLVECGGQHGLDGVQLHGCQVVQAGVTAAVTHELRHGRP